MPRWQLPTNDIVIKPPNVDKMRFVRVGLIHSPDFREFCCSFCGRAPWRLCRSSCYLLLHTPNRFRCKVTLVLELTHGNVGSQPPPTLCILHSPCWPHALRQPSHIAANMSQTSQIQHAESTESQDSNTEARKRKEKSRRPASYVSSSSFARRSY